MSDKNDKELHERMRHLERRVEQLEKQLREEKERDLVTPKPSPEDQSFAQKRSEETGSRFIPDEIQFDEQWLNRIGIGLLLIGVAFLFKYSVDQGWLIPPVRSMIGLGIGMFLFGSGLRMDESMNPFRQIMLGGGIGVFYITGFATYQLYTFLPVTIIWLFMIVVTLLALSLSLQQNEPILSVTGILGALGTPFMLYSGSGSVVMLMAYTVLILVAAAVIYYKKGWQSLLWSILTGGLTVVGVGVVTTSFYSEPATEMDRWMLQFGVVVWALCSWGIAVARNIGEPVREASAAVHLSVFAVPLWILPLVVINWELNEESLAMVAFGLAAIGAAGYYTFQHRKASTLALSHGLMGLIMGTIGVILFFEGTPLYIILVAETVALRYIAMQTGVSRLSIGSHFLFLVVLLWTFNALSEISYSEEASLLSIDAFSQLIFIIVSGTYLSAWLPQEVPQKLYRITSHLLLLFWIYQMFSMLSNGQAWVTITWGLYAIVLIAAGFIKFGRDVRLTGMATLFLVVAKLFWVDLAQLQALWRILLFIGFGGVLMLLGYYLQSTLHKAESEI
ncbi:DUF2339 domain-containing protein [Aliifodinibius salicampi]|uniref:DUF2339 domain-containing protein n=1 Tax=Fodinibius salicampi TaxID=1920655 RepID=A0ABT3Q2T7_9BACT|nr:DUF2339 domain-containing protein [Fodinibius salicampi]MCW9714432.1 DUF2339 domain-containing protein [Fodinibius salicampi]